jgi:hypothetical protein
MTASSPNSMGGFGIPWEGGILNSQCTKTPLAGPVPPVLAACDVFWVPIYLGLNAHFFVTQTAEGAIGL